jgi:uncharacterized glyoxalase superfamily protein PhnB
VHENDDGKVVHAEFDQGAGQTIVYVAVEEVDSLHERAAGAGAEILMEPEDQDYGSRDFAARDPEGNIWSFGTYRLGQEALGPDG